MLKRDLIMVQIEELGKVIAQVILNRNTNAARKNPELIQTVYTSLNLSKDFLLNTSLEDLRHFLDKDDAGGLSRMDLAAKILIEESHLHPHEQSPLLLKAKEMLEYVQRHDTTFSLERVALLSGI